MKKYYLHDGKQQEGPFDIDELKAKNLNRDTPIWFEGLNEWTTINNVDELKDIITAIPPPFATAMASPPSIQKLRNEQKPFENKSVNKSSLFRNLLILAGIIVIIFVGSFIYNQMEHQEAENYRQNIINAEEDLKTKIRNNITTYVTAEHSAYNFNVLGGVSNLKITVRNSSDYLIDNVKVKVIYVKADGDIWGSKIIDFNLLNPNTKTTLKVDDTDRGVKVQIEIVSIKSAALGLN